MIISQPFWTTAFTNPLFLVLFGMLVLVLVALVVVMVFMNPSRNESVQEARVEAEHLLISAREEGNALRMRAIKDAEKIAADTKKADEEFRTEQVRQIEAVTTQAKDLLHTQTAAITQICENMRKNLTAQAQMAEKTLQDESARMGKTMSEAEALLQQTLVHAGEEAQKGYQALTEAVKKRLTTELEGEIEAARKAVIAYKEERFAVIDKEIVSLVEDTARLALHKSFSFDDHRGVILDALTEAKQKGVFGAPTTT
jgi:hypothetical protein